jgi:2-amino-4-hydroxy-6-hydroxymethyldihydropteridine diphosphokinase
VSAVVSLGANLGDRLAALQMAVDRLAGRFPVTAVSSVYETTPVGGPPQPDYLNAVLLLTAADPAALLTAALDAEAAAGRQRVERWGPRTLDVDLVAVDDLRLQRPDLTLPHPRAHQRAFVLVPWHEVDPAAVLPGHGPVADLLRGVDAAGVRRRADLRLPVGSR